MLFSYLSLSRIVFQTDASSQSESEQQAARLKEEERNTTDDLEG